MAKIKTKDEIELMRIGGKHLAAVLREVEKLVAPGVTTKELNDLAEKKIRETGDEPAFLNYTPWGAKRPYPATLCVSVNDEVVHGIPNEDVKTLQEGDIVSLDIGLKHKGLVLDMATTIGVGSIDQKVQMLLDTTKASLKKGIAACVLGNEVNDIGKAIEAYAKPFGYGIVEDLGGHGVGHKVHEPPYIHNYDTGEKSEKLKEGMVLAIEPMLNEGRKDVVLAPDGYTYKTKDGKRSAHFEHTIVVTSGKPEILTA